MNERTDAGSDSEISLVALQSRRGSQGRNGIVVLVGVVLVLVLAAGIAVKAVLGGDETAVDEPAPPPTLRARNDLGADPGG